MLTTPQHLVNRWLWSLLLVLLWAGQGCGFQLNRNQVVLPEGAKSISIDRISNQSFVARLDVALKSELRQHLARNSITLRPEAGADLRLEVRIISAPTSRRDLALNQVQNYEFRSEVNTKVSLVDQRNQKKLMDDLEVQGVALKETTDENLETRYEEELRSQALTALAQAIAARLTENF